MNNRNRGKRTEADIAKRMNGKRVGIMGGEDISHPYLSIEVKNRTRCVVQGWIDQAKRNSSENKIPCVIIHIHGQRHNSDMICFTLKDYEDWYGKVKGVSA